MCPVASAFTGTESGRALGLVQYHELVVYGGSECKGPERALSSRRRRRQYDVVFVDQVSAVIPVLHLLTRSKVRPACISKPW